MAQAFEATLMASSEETHVSGCEARRPSFRPKRRGCIRGTRLSLTIVDKRLSTARQPKYICCFSPNPRSSQSTIFTGKYIFSRPCNTNAKPSKSRRLALRVRGSYCGIERHCCMFLRLQLPRCEESKGYVLDLVSTIQYGIARAPGRMRPFI